MQTKPTIMKMSSHAMGILKLKIKKKNLTVRIDDHLPISWQFTNDWTIVHVSTRIIISRTDGT
jgi:hypothetical protein